MRRLLKMKCDVKALERYNPNTMAEKNMKRYRGILLIFNTPYFNHVYDNEAAYSRTPRCLLINWILLRILFQTSGMIV